MTRFRSHPPLWADLVVLLVIGVLFVIPFIFILLIASKTPAEAGLSQFALPSDFRLFQNLSEVIQFGNHRVFRALWNSTVLTVGSVILIVVLSASIAYVLQRRNDRLALIVNILLLCGLVLPPAIVPTIFVLQTIGIYKSMISVILVSVALGLPFATLIMRAFVASIPREIDEAAIIDGASRLQLFFYVILPLLRPAIITVTVVTAVGIYNDFTLPLYFLPGADNITAQLTLFSFMTQFSSQWNLLFANVVIITIPPLIMYIFFQRHLVAGLTSGAVKG